MIAGYQGNVVDDGIVGGTISGGGLDDGENQVSSDLGTIGGGSSNVVSAASGTISGGSANILFGEHGTIAGGDRKPCQCGANGVL